VHSTVNANDLDHILIIEITMKLLSISTLLLATAGVSATQSLTPESFNDFRASGALFLS
jgi:hypothetical protein